MNSWIFYKDFNIVTTQEEKIMENFIYPLITNHFRDTIIRQPN